MKTLTLAEAWKLIDSCSAVIWDDDHRFVIYPDFVDLTGKPDDEWLFLGGEDDDGRAYSVKFTEGENANVRMDGADMFLTDTEGEEIKVTLLVLFKDVCVGEHDSQVI